MNCTICNTPLETNARFCPKCGTPTSQMVRNNAAPSFADAHPIEPPTIPPTPSPFHHLSSNQPDQTYLPHLQQSWSQPSSEPPTAPPWSRPSVQQSASSSQQPIQPVQYTPPQQPQYLSNNRSGSQAGTFASADEPPRRRRRGCLPGCLITLVVLLILLVGGWFLALRPYLDNMAQSKINDALTSAVDNIPAAVAATPAGPVSIPEKLLNNLLVLNSSPNDLVKNMQIHITSTQMRLEFQVFGFSCAVTGVPIANNGKLTVTNVTVEGIAALILTSDEITTLANQHLADAVKKINHSISSVQLKDQELDLVLGPQSTTLPTLP